MGMWIICGVALWLFVDGLFCAFLLLRMILLRRRQPNEPAPGAEVWLDNYEAMIIRHALIFAEVPSAFWLEPARWERPEWPAPPPIVKIDSNIKRRWDRRSR